MKKSILLCGLFLFFLTSQSFANDITWTDWTSKGTNTVIGTMGGVTVTYTGSYYLADLGGGTNYWTEGTPPPYTGSTLIDNAPTAGELIRLNHATSNKIKFSTPVLNPIMAIVSMGSNSIPVTYDFDKAFIVLSDGKGYWNYGTYTEDSDNILVGKEFHGVIQFSGWVSEINFSSTAEGWSGFTFGTADPTDENDCNGAYTQADIDAAKEKGRQECITDPSSCGIDTNGGINDSITINSDLSFSFEGTYSSPFGDIDLTANFKFFGEQNGKILWELDSYTAK